MRVDYAIPSTGRSRKSAKGADPSKGAFGVSPSRWTNQARLDVAGSPVPRLNEVGGPTHSSATRAPLGSGGDVLIELEQVGRVVLALEGAQP